MGEAERLERAERARSELMLTEQAFDKLRASLTEKLLTTTLEQSGLRERLYSAVQSLDAVREALRQAVQDGDVVNYQTLLAENGFQR
jgi:type VI protein secretion system component VasK